MANNKSFSIFSCGALSVGDQILSIDETIIENTNYTPEEVMSFLNGPSDRGFTQIQILPVHTLNRKGNALLTRLLAQNHTPINYLCFTPEVKRRKCRISFIHILSSL